MEGGQEGRGVVDSAGCEGVEEDPERRVLGL